MTVLRIPHALLYWSVLPNEFARKPLATQAYRFEQVVPVPVESLQVTSATLPSGQVVMTAIDPADLRSYCSSRSDLTPQIWELLPDRLPEHLLAQNIPESVLNQLNQLHGDFEPLPHIHARRQKVIRTLTIFAAVLVLIVIGAERRSHAHDQEADQLTAATTARIDATVPGHGVHPLPAELRLLSESRRLEQASGMARPSATIVSVLEPLWEYWPTDVRTQIESVSVTADHVVLRGRVLSLEDAQKIFQAMPVHLAHLHREPLQAQRTGAVTTLSLSWSAEHP